MARAAEVRRLRVAGSFVLLGFLAVGGWALTRTPLFAVDAVEVVGVQAELAAQVRAVAGLPPGTNLLDVDLPGVAAAVERLGWVVDATATRRPPSTIELRVVARAPAAYLEAGGAGWLVADDGTVLAAAEPTTDLLLISVPAVLVPAPGEAIADQTVLTALDVAADLPAGLLRNVLRIEAAAGTQDLIVAIPSEYGTQNVRVRLGTADDVAQKAQAVLALVDQVRAHAREGITIATIDVRAPRHPVLVPA